MVAVALLASCLALTSATAATFATAPAGRAAPAELYGALEVNGYDVKPAEVLKGLPGQVRKSLRRFRVGVGGMWNNYGEVRRIKKGLRQTGESATYPQLLLMRKTGEDTTKFIQAGAIWLAVPELFPLALYCFPRLIPSTFETDASRAKRYRAMSIGRTKAVTKLLTHVEDKWVQSEGWARQAKKDQAQLHHSLAGQVLTGGSEFAGLRPLTPYVLPAEAAATPRKQRRQMLKCLDGLPNELLNAACGVVGLSELPVLGWRRKGLVKHLAALQAEDAALSAGGMRSLSEAHLMEACFDRGMGTSGASAAELRGQLQRWLQLADNLVVLQGEHLEPQPLRMRLAALAAFGVATTRRAQDCKLVRQLLI